MINFEQIVLQYPEALRGFTRNILREYLQYKVLEAIFASPAAEKLCFIGGTALRIVHGTSRFSEDLDFDNFSLSKDEFQKISNKVVEELELEGFQVEIKNVLKNAYRCYIRIPKLLFEMGISPVKEEKIMIQLDTESQGIEYKPEIKLINKFDVFARIRVAPAEILLAQKIFAALNRKRAKGRDFYDIVFLFAKTKPNFSYLKTKLEIANMKELKATLKKFCKTADFKALTADVAPFLFSEKERNKVLYFKDFVEGLLVVDEK